VIIAKLMYVTELKQNYVTVARNKIGYDFMLTKVIPGERAIFEQINSNDSLTTSIVKEIGISEDKIIVVTENSRYRFKVI
jgi:ribosome biogenesis SPOUT family RNA methylase Rps3